MSNLLPTGHGRILKFFEDLHKQNTQAGWGIQLCNNPGPAINWIHLKLVKDRLNAKPLNTYISLKICSQLSCIDLSRYVKVVFNANQTPCLCQRHPTLSDIFATCPATKRSSPRTVEQHRGLYAPGWYAVSTSSLVMLEVHFKIF